MGRETVHERREGGNRMKERMGEARWTPDCFNVPGSALEALATFPPPLQKDQRLCACGRTSSALAPGHSEKGMEGKAA